MSANRAMHSSNLQLNELGQTGLHRALLGKVETRPGIPALGSIPADTR